MFWDNISEAVAELLGEDALVDWAQDFNRGDGEHLLSP
jgi:hypothetical protein